MYLTCGMSHGKSPLNEKSGKLRKDEKMNTAGDYWICPICGEQVSWNSTHFCIESNTAFEPVCTDYDSEIIQRLDKIIELLENIVNE